MNQDTDRIDALEARIAFQDDTIQALNDALIAQQQRIDRVQAELARLLETLQRELTDERAVPEDERPPHY
jgi:SlyX protein